MIKQRAITLRCPRCKKSHLQAADEKPHPRLGIFWHMCLYCCKIFAYEEKRA